MSQVNLLPPELLARQKTRALTTLIAGAGIALLVLLVAFWFLQSKKVSSADDKVAAQNATNAQIQQQITGLQGAQDLQTQAAAQQALLAKAFSGSLKLTLVTLVYDVLPEVPTRPTSLMEPGMNWGWLNTL